MWTIGLLSALFSLAGSLAHAQTFDPSTYYSILGISPDATPLEVETAFKAALNRFPEQASQNLIRQAHTVLTDPVKRVKYDQVLTGTRYRSVVESDWMWDPALPKLRIGDALAKRGFHYNSVRYFFSTQGHSELGTDLASSAMNRRWNHDFLAFHNREWFAALWFPTGLVAGLGFIADPPSIGLIAGSLPLFVAYFKERAVRKNDASALHDHYEGAHSKFFSEPLAAEHTLAIRLVTFDAFEQVMQNVYTNPSRPPFKEREVEIHFWLDRFAKKSAPFRLAWFIRALQKGELGSRLWRLTLASEPKLWLETVAELENELARISAFHLELIQERYQYATELDDVKDHLQDQTWISTQVAYAQKVFKSRCAWFLSAY